MYSIMVISILFRSATAFVFTLTHGSWLNFIESFFGKMARQCLYGILFESKQKLVDRIYKYCDEVNKASVVYHWPTRLIISPQKILQRLKLVLNSDTWHNIYMNISRTDY